MARQVGRGDFLGDHSCTCPCHVCGFQNILQVPCVLQHAHTHVLTVRIPFLFWLETSIFEISGAERLWDRGSLSLAWCPWRDTVGRAWSSEVSRHGPGTHGWWGR